MLLPAYVDNEGNPVFYKSEINIYGFPDVNGWEGNYFVVDNEKLLVPSYQQVRELEFDSQLVKPVHRYCRKSRFRTCLFQLLGKIGFVGKSKELIQTTIRDEIGEFERNYLPPCLIWEYLRKILKQYKLQSFYNRIPAVARICGMTLDKSVYTAKNIQNILIDFDIMDDVFPRIKHALRRKYFPSLRFTCIMLMAKNNIVPPVEVPVARTIAKGLLLQQDFDEIWMKINDEVSSYIFD